MLSNQSFMVGPLMLTGTYPALLDIVLLHINPFHAIYNIDQKGAEICDRKSRK